MFMKYCYLKFINNLRYVILCRSRYERYFYGEYHSYLLCEKAFSNLSILSSPRVRLEFKTRSQKRQFRL